MEINTRKNSTKVRQYTTNGEFVAEYESITHASKETGVNQTSIANALWWKKNRTAKGFIWTEVDEDITVIVEKNKKDAEKQLHEKKKAALKGTKKEKRIEIDWRVERVKDYIFIEKDLCGSELCARCSINANGDDCLPCRKDERKDGKQGYWRYSKPL